MAGVEIGTFYNEIQELAQQNLCTAKDESQLIKLISEVFNRTEQEVSRSVSAVEKSHMDCKAGCSICCRVHVPVLPPEALIIREYLTENLREDQIAQLIKDMKRLSLEIKFLDEIERIFANKKCIFLDSEGTCSIYPVRPLLCRSVTSADVSTCRDSIKMIALDQTINIPMNIRQKSLFDTAFKALADTMERHGLPDRSEEITESMLKIL